MAFEVSSIEVTLPLHNLITLMPEDWLFLMDSIDARDSV